jgi:phosphoenolpyruvate carboxykinase (ATP)
MSNIEITTHPTGRSPENKYFFGNKTDLLDLTRPKYNKIGEQDDFWKLHGVMYELEYNHNLVFYTCGICFRVETNDDRHAQFVRNMFTVEDNPLEHTADWTILHNTDLKVDEPKILVHLDECRMLIAGTTFLGEIKKGVFGIVSFELPESNILPMHCSAFTYNDTTNLMFGLSGTGKTTLSSDPEYQLISDDEVYWQADGIQMIETGCYAKSEGLTPETHPTIFNAVELARERNTLVVENPGAANARLSYPIDCVENAYPAPQQFDHPTNIFFLTMDVTGRFPAVCEITGDTVRRFFETGYTSQMPGTEAGSDEIKKVFSPCYGSPFMPRSIDTYSDLLMDKIEKNNCRVFLVNTGMGEDGKRYALDYTRNCVKTSINWGAEDRSDECLAILEDLING